MSGRHKAENKTSERPGEIIAGSVQGMSWKTESKRTRLHQSKRNGNFYFPSPPPHLFFLGEMGKKPQCVILGQPKLHFECNILF